MANSVSNDALWEKLSEISEQLKGSRQTDNTPDLSEITEAIQAFRQSNNTYFEEHKKHIGLVNKNILLGLKRVASIQEQIESHAEQPQRGSYFDLKFFKLRKTSVVITLLGLLVLTLTVFCMKQQNDYALLLDEFYRQSIDLREIQVEGDSLKSPVNDIVSRER